MFPRFSLAAAAVASIFFQPAVAAPAVDAGLIVVTATRQATRHSELLSDASAVDRTEISRASAIETFGDLLAREAGIETVTTGSPGSVSNVFIRGTNGGHTLLLIDGMRVGSATLGEPGISRIPLAQIERVEILRGPASGLYGSDAIGGVIQVFTRPTADGTHLSAGASFGSFNTREADAGFSTRSNGLSASLHIGAHKSDGFTAIHKTTNPAFNVDDDGYKNTNLTASLGYAFSAGHEVGASVFNSDGENQYDGRYFDGPPLFAGHSDYDFRARQKINSVSLFSNNRLATDWTSKVQLGRSTDDSINYDQPSQSSRFKTEQRQLTWQNDIRLPGVGKVLLAAERLEQEIDASSTYVLTERSINSALAGWTGAYGQHRVQANVRYDKNSQFGNKTTGNVAYGFPLAASWRIRLAAGTAFKAPTFNDLYFPEVAFVGGGNPNLKPEKARSSEIGLNHESANGFITLTAYQSTIEDLIAWQPDVATDPFSPWHPVNVGKATMKGLSASAKQRYGDLAVRASYDYLDAKDSSSDKELVLRARHRGSFGVEQQLGNTTLSAEIQGVGRRYNDPTNTVVLAGYSVVNLLVEQALGKDVKVFAKANNVFDRFYEVRDDYATAGRSFFVGVRYSNQ